MADTLSLQERIKKNILIDDKGCWLWQLFIDKDGYGVIHIRDGGSQRAHRRSYEAFGGEIPDDFHIDHLCRNRACVNPDHLEPVTCKENIARGNTGFNNKSKTHCPAGHLYADNLILEKDGGRKCRKCVYARNSLRKRLKVLANPKMHHSQVLKQRTHCNHGHEFSEDNILYVSGFRKCKTCNRESSRRAWAKSKLVGAI